MTPSLKQIKILRWMGDNPGRHWETVILNALGFVGDNADDLRELTNHRPRLIDWSFGNGHNEAHWEITPKGIKYLEGLEK